MVAATAIGATAACRKPAPQEQVYTGRTVGVPTGALAPAPTTSAPPVVEPPPPADAFTKPRLLAAAADCALGRYRAFEGLALPLRDAARAHARDRSAANLTALRDAWRGAMSVWQEAEVFRIGPAAAVDAAGGQGLRDQIYPWPLTNRCRVDEQLASRTYAEPAFPTTLVNGRGLAAVEYLAFHSGGDNGCSQFSVINAQGTWAAIPPGDLAQRKADYAVATAEDVVLRANALVRAWEPAGGDFRAALATAGAGSRVFATDTDALNALSDAMFYLEKDVKDLKLGRPLGLLECASARCPEALESQYARVSTAHLRANLVGFRRLLQGCGEGYAGFGFDDWLRAIGAGDLATRMLAATASAQATVDALDVPLEDALATAPERALALHVAVKTVTDLLKTEFVTVLNLELPKTTEGDND